VWNSRWPIPINNNIISFPLREAFTIMKDRQHADPISEFTLPTHYTVRQILHGILFWAVLRTISCSLTSAFTHTFSKPSSQQISVSFNPNPVPDIDVMLYKEIERLMAEKKILAEEFKWATKQKMILNQWMRVAIMRRMEYVLVGGADGGQDARMCALYGKEVETESLL
jgi:hypothetical protein